VAVLLVTHTTSIPILGVPSRNLLAALTALFMFLVGEMFWMYSLRRPPSARLLRSYSTVSVWVLLVLITCTTMVSNVEDTHYSALMVLPVTSAAFRFSRRATLGVVAIAGFLNIAAVRYYYFRHPPSQIGEYYEAFSVSLIFLTVGIIVSSLVRNLRADQAKLRTSVAELERARDRLVTEEKLGAVGRFASAIAHEIRNPVAIIASSLATATREATATRDREQMYEIAAAEAKRLETLTSDFLSYARTREPDLQRTAAGTALEYVSSLVQVRAREQGVAVTVRVPEDLVVLMDLFQVQQAVLNLALNALDATRTGGRVVLGADAVPEGGCELFVENDGPALTPEVATRIFEPFFTSRPKGTGLGLAITRSIARAHGGEARLAFNEPGRVRFAISLPSVPPKRRILDAENPDRR
jgi:signal transduction histidine kinase